MRHAVILSVVLALAAVAARPCAPAREGPRPVQLSPCSRAFVFVDHGRPAATIVIPENAGETERRAADILRTSVLKMSGVDLPIRSAAAPGRPNIAAIGFPPRDLPPAVTSALPALHPDGFVAATSAGNLYITGGAAGASSTASCTSSRSTSAAGASVPRPSSSRRG